MDLLQRFAAGEMDVFESLFRQHQSEVFRWIVRIVRDRAAAEELTVETFWRFYNARGRLDPKGNCGAWLRRVATNAAIDYLRRARDTETLDCDPPGPPAPDAMEQQELGAAIRKAVAELSPRLRIVVQLGLVEGESNGKIAEALGISPIAVKLRMFRATRMLRSKLEKQGVKP